MQKHTNKLYVDCNELQATYLLHRYLDYELDDILIMPDGRTVYRYRKTPAVMYELRQYNRVLENLNPERYMSEYKKLMERTRLLTEELWQMMK